MRLGRLLGTALLVLGTSPVVLVAGAAPACAAGEMRVAVVVDFGDLANPPPSSSVCVAASDGDTAAQVMAARAKQLGTPPPRYDSSGLLCSIDGLPATGCGVRTNDGYKYWSYFHGTASGWQYSNVGPAGSRAKATTTEGWRFTDGSGLPSDPRPAGNPDPAATCRPAPTATTQRPNPGNTGAPPPTERSPGAAAATTVARFGGTTTTSAALAGAGTPTSTTTGVATAEGAAASQQGGDQKGSVAAAEVAAARAAGRDQKNSAAGTLVGVAVVAALIGGGVLVARRRR